MSTRQRRERGTARDRTATLYGRVRPETKAKVDKIADALGLSAAQVLEDLINHADVDAHGRPSWFEGPLATDAHEELPLQHTA